MKKEGEDANLIHIVCAADVHYGSYAGIMLSSVLAHNEPRNIHCHLFDDGIARKDLDRMTSMMRAAGANFSVYSMTEVLDRQPGVLQQMAHYTRAAFGRLFIAEILPETVNRVIYFDCDMICLSDLEELWRVDAEILGAVRDEWIDNNGYHKESISLPVNAKYYNSGLLLMNLKEWRRRGFSETIITYLGSTPRALYPDQDALNSLLWSEITELPTKWNVFISSPAQGQAVKNLRLAANIHYCAGFKPWHIGYAWFYPASAEYRQAKATSPWKWKMPDFHIGRAKRKLKVSSGRWLLPHGHANKLRVKDT